MNILFVTCDYRLFNKLDCGAAIRSTMFVEALAKISHVDVVSFYKDTIESNIDNCDVIGCYPYVIEEKKVTNLSKLSYYLRTLFLPLSSETYYHKNKKIEKIIDNQVKSKEYDYIACRYISDAVTCGLEKYSNKLIIDVDDNLVSASLRDISFIKFNNYASKALAYYRAYAIGFMSYFYLKKIRISFFSNINESPFKYSSYLPNVTTINSKVNDINENTPFNILFVGWLDFSPNANGILHFINNVFPLIKKQIPKAELHIAGKTSNPKLLSLLNSIDGVKALGFVDDILYEYNNCRVIIVPMYQGAGTSVKFVEGIMMKRPIVSTYYGIRGFEKLFTPNVDYLLAMDDKEFAEKVIYLLNSKEESIKMAHNAYLIGNKYFSKDNFINIIKKEILKNEKKL